MQMDDIGPWCKNISLHGQMFVGEDQLYCSNKEIVDMDLLMENLDISDEDDLNDLMLQELENLHVKKAICSSTSNDKSLQISSPNTTELKDLSKCAAILCSEVLQSCPILANVELSTIELGYETSGSASNPAEDRLVPCYVSSKFVSALKGSRARQRKPLDPNLHVTWAADVYDPPVTSSSHTVKGHRHRVLKAKMSDHHKHNKHMKAKSSNASSGDRKHSHRRSSSSILDPRMARMEAFSRRSLQTGFGLSKIQALDVAAASGQESTNCAGSFHAESQPWPLPLPIAEAS